MPFELWLCLLDGPNITQVEQIMAYIHSSTSCTSLWSLLERASPTCSVPLVPELHSSLKASPYYLGKKEREVDTFNECATSLPWQQTSRQQCFPQPKTLSTSISFVPNFIYSFGARATSQTKSWSNQLFIAGQLAMMDSSLRQCTLGHLLRLRFETWLINTLHTNNVWMSGSVLAC